MPCIPDPGLEGTLSGGVYIFRCHLFLFYTCSLFNSRAMIPFRSPLQNRRALSSSVHVHGQILWHRSWPQAPACSYSIPSFCSTDPKCCAMKAPLAAVTKLSFYSWKTTNSPTPWQGDMSHTKKFKSVLCGSSQLTEPAAEWTQPVLPRPWLPPGCGP